MPTPEDKSSAVTKFLKELEGKVDPVALEAAKSTLDPSKPEAEPLLTALATGLQNGWAAQSTLGRVQQEAAEARRQAEAIRQDYLAKEEAVIAYKQHLESNAVSFDDYNQVKAQLDLVQQQQQAALLKLNELGIDLDGGGQNNMNQNTQFNNQNPNYNQNPNQNPNRQQGSQGQQNQQNQNQNPTQPFNYMTVEQAQAVQEQVVAGTLLEQARMTAMMNEHQALTGKPLDIVALTQEALDKNMPPAKYWEQKFKITDLRQEAQVKQREAEIEYRAQEIVAKRLSEERMTGFNQQNNQFKNAASYAYQAAVNDRGAKEVPRINDFMASTMQATSDAVREYESVMATGKFTDGQTMEEARRSMGIA